MATTDVSRTTLLLVHGAWHGSWCWDVREVSRPLPRAGEASVRIHASGTNPLDIKIRAGQAAHARHPLPAVLGMDLAGVVEAVGPDAGMSSAASDGGPTCSPRSHSGKRPTREYSRFIP